jgi:small neutral amino acid transporter SnatA (MarC family)
MLHYPSYDLFYSASILHSICCSRSDSEAHTRTDISVFPLGTPLIAGPGALASILVLQGDATIYPFGTAIVLGIR